MYHYHNQNSSRTYVRSSDVTIIGLLVVIAGLVSTVTDFSDDVAGHTLVGKDIFALFSAMLFFLGDALLTLR